MAAPRKYPEELGERAIRLAGRRGLERPSCQRWHDYDGPDDLPDSHGPGHDFAEECEFEGAQNLVDDNPTRGRAQPDRAARGSATGGRGNP